MKELLLNPFKQQSRQIKWRGETIVSPHAKTIELTHQNWLAYLFDEECKAVNNWPDDVIVRHNAVIIRRIEKLVEIQIRTTDG